MVNDSLMIKKIEIKWDGANQKTEYKSFTPAEIKNINLELYEEIMPLIINLVKTQSRAG